VGKVNRVECILVALDEGYGRVVEDSRAPFH
jgi:hypothetical protein